MAEVRGEKVSFSKRDIVPLHAMPSAMAEDPLIVHCPRAVSIPGRCARWLVSVLLLFVAVLVALTVAIETGSLDAPLSSQARTLLDGQMGDRYQAQIGSAALRFGSGFRLVLEARDVDIVERDSARHLTKTGSIFMVLDPLSLLAGRLSVSMIEVDSIDIDTAFLPQGAPLDISSLRIDNLPEGAERLFSRLDLFLGAVMNARTGRVAVTGLTVRAPGGDDGPLLFNIERLDLSRGSRGEVLVRGEVEFNGQNTALSLTLENDGRSVTSFEAAIDGLDLFPFTSRHYPDGTISDGLEVNGGIRVRGVRAQNAGQPSLSAIIGAGAGTFYMGGASQQVTGATLMANYDPEARAVSVGNSFLQLGQTRIPLSAVIRDRDEGDRGFDVKLNVTGGVASAENSGEAPVPFNIEASGWYLTGDKQLDLSALHVSSPAGSMAGSLRVRFGHGSPEISFGGQIPAMEAAAVKQLWPFWMARKPRTWAVANIFGGTVRNGSIAVFLPSGRMLGPGHPLELNENELHIRFDIEDTRLNLTGDLPPLRGIDASVDIRGEKVGVSVREAASYFSSGREVKVEKGEFSIASTYAKPLMSDLDIVVSGASDAIAELVAFDPLHALRDSGFTPEDFSGPMRAQARARFGLISDQHPPSPVWNASMTLAGVSLARPVDGRRITDINGSLVADNDTVRLDGNARINDVPMEISLVEPARKDSATSPTRTLKASLDRDQLRKFAPGLSDVVDGPVAVDISSVDRERTRINVDLTRTVIKVPVIGWTKGAGISANARFEMSKDGDKTRVDGFDLRGDGFGAQGALVVNEGGLVSARLDKLNLSQGDNYALDIRPAGKGYSVTASGASIDLRPLVARLRGKGDSASQDQEDLPDISFKGRFDSITGFNGESISNVTSSVVMRSGRLQSMDFSGVTGSGQAMVAKTTTNAGSNIISLTSGDAGAFTRFMDIYGRIRGGLLNVSLTTADGASWNGSVDMRNFALANEQKLQSMVETPAGQDGRSLNRAVRREIDVSSERFQRGFARIGYRGGQISVENGVVRGEQIGATFQGTLRDRSGNMDMTGTFMPAYGLNRLFAELPLIGVILGNGRDRGLLGITFRMTGRFDTPRLTINPLSLIAPGVFRQIFEFQ